MRPQDYRHFHAELDFLNSLPGVEVHMHTHFIELPLLAEVFRQLQHWPHFGEYQWLIFSRQHDPEQIRMPLNRRTILFYMSNEDGTLPDFYSQVGWVFTPDLRPGEGSGRVHLIPLGCNGDVVEAPWVNWEDRKLDVFFSGQVLPWRAPFIHEAIQLLFDIQPNLNVQAQIQFTPRFRSGLSPEAYARTLMSSKIALIPPGFSPITLRMFEAMRSGCILFTYELPDFWYLQGLPRVVMPQDWKNLSQEVLTLLQDPERQLAMHKATRRHYLSYCTPEAIKTFVCRLLEQSAAGISLVTDD